MASGRWCKLRGLITEVSSRNSLPCVRTACVVPVRQKSSIGPHLLDEPDNNVEIGVTSDGKTIVCYHPTVDIPYELTQPIERPDPLTNQVESHDQVLKTHLSKEVLKDKEGPTVEELSKMFFTTKHRFYPFGQYHQRRIKKGPPKDR